MHPDTDFLPEIDPIAVIPIGHAARALRPPRREPLETKVHGERFGEPWPNHDATQAG